jgi:hypothetical protein
MICRNMKCAFVQTILAESAALCLPRFSQVVALVIDLPSRFYFFDDNHTIEFLLQFYNNKQIP